jgi:hypothetical protein
MPLCESVQLKGLNESVIQDDWLKMEVKRCMPLCVGDTTTAQELSNASDEAQDGSGVIAESVCCYAAPLHATDGVKCPIADSVCVDLAIDK